MLQIDGYWPHQWWAGSETSNAFSAQFVLIVCHSLNEFALQVENSWKEGIFMRVFFLFLLFYAFFGERFGL